MRLRGLAWVLVLPLVAASVLTGHALAYALTGRPLGPEHDYLAHAPQVVALVALLALVGLAAGQRAERPGTRGFAALGALAFALQEHLEGYVHTGHVPFLLTNRTFLLGLLLQIPVGIASVALARRLLVALSAPGRPRRPPATWLTPLVVAPVVHAPVRGPGRAATRGRAPPHSSRP